MGSRGVYMQKPWGDKTWVTEEIKDAVIRVEQGETERLLNPVLKGWDGKRKAPSDSTV